MKFTKIDKGHYQAEVNEEITINLYKVDYAFVGNSTEYEIEINGSYFGNGGKLKETKERVQEILNIEDTQKLVKWFASWSNSVGDFLRFTKVIGLIKNYRDVEVSVEVVEEKPVLKKETINNTQVDIVEYKGNKVLCFGEPSEFNNISVEGWIIHPNNYEEELSTIYAEGYNSYCEAVKAIFNDLEKRLKHCKVQIEELSFI